MLFKETKMDPLRNFFMGYFHQDWVLDDDTPLGVVRRYCDENPELRHEVADLLIGLVDGPLSDPELEQLIVGELRAEFVPSQMGDSMRAWLYKFISVLKGDAPK